MPSIVNVWTLDAKLYGIRPKTRQRDKPEARNV